MRSQQNICYVNLKEASPRLLSAQELLEKSILSQGLTPLPFPGGKNLTLFGDVLKFARVNTVDQPIVWCNSDVILRQSPFDVPDKGCAYGFHRTETPSGDLCSGIDMYYIPLLVWDEILSQDIPKLYLGASFVDWWISRKLESLGIYKTLAGYIDHPSHEKSGSAADATNRYYRENLGNFNDYAKRNNLSKIPAPPYYLPKIGFFWGVRDGLEKLLKLRPRSDSLKN